ncbi:hypothetical protein KM295_06420 [Natronomonas sp. F2-12]|uniref:Uncharacterized protein n=1 Tax=Natronomonas aquatica TaxID=2841590 RepID=A0A9R1D6I9_9EURY|nr:hypothetical protein [Natronomonas aquatica]MCQ4333127.1 hypothetical protein [Natronomonas aquatica]
MVDNLNPLFNRVRKVNRNLNSLIFSWNHDYGTNIFSKDWDNLIILDSCRYDTLKSITNKNKSSSIISRGSSSYEFVKNNFEKQLHDTIYITTNPHIEKIEKNEFFIIKKIYDEYEDSFNINERRTMLDNLRKESQRMVHENPNKKLIIHSMIPHAPYISSEAENLRKKLSEEKNITFVNSKGGRGANTQEKAKNKTNPNKFYSLLGAAKNGYISDNRLYEIYKQEVKTGFNWGEKLANELDGKSIITADHGELLGERLLPLLAKEYGHHCNIYCEELRKVPWVVYPSDNRRNIIASEPVDTQHTQTNIEENLKALGYKN